MIENSVFFIKTHDKKIAKDQYMLEGEEIIWN